MKKLTKKQRKNLGIVLASTSAISVFIILICSIISSMISGKELSKEKSFDFDKIEIAKPEYDESFLTKNINSRPGKALDKISGIVVHYTANPGTDAKANRNYFESRKDCADAPANKVSSHFIIGLKGNIIQCIPTNEIAYASNDRNDDTISIECCHPDKSGEFSPETYQSLVHLVAYLCDKFQLTPDNVIRHYDVSGKICPKYFVDNKNAWKEFLDDISFYLNEGQ